MVRVALALLGCGEPPASATAQLAPHLAKPAPPAVEALPGVWRHVSGPQPFGDPEAPSQWGLPTYVTFVEQAPGRGRIEVVGQVPESGATLCATSGTWLQRAQGDVWFEMDGLTFPFVVRAQGFGGHLFVERDDQVTHFERVAAVPVAARCARATEVSRFALPFREPSGWLGFDGTDLVLEVQPGASYALSPADGAVQRQLSSHPVYERPIAYQGDGLWATGQGELALLDPPPSLLLVMNLRLTLGVDIDVRAGAWDGSAVVLHGPVQGDERLVTVDVGARTVLSDLPARATWPAMTHHIGSLWAVLDQPTGSVLVELDPVTGRAIRTVVLPDAGTVRGVASVGGHLFAVGLRGRETDLVDYQLP